RWLNFNNPALTQFAPTLVLPQAWVIFKNADGGSDTWKTYDSTLNNVAVTIPGFGTQNLNLKIVVNGNKSTDTTVTVSGKSYTAKRYISTARVGGYLVASPTTEAFYISIATTFSLIDGVGIYQSNTPNSNLMALTGAALAKVPGNRSTLTSFMLK
ncbi:MAG: hypothetical protein JNL32_14550, partial [Candidatus Kapabacteria bacterium]|nr:hypothetical protein [Candidatus Kapabacteria bacterium]